MKNHFRYSVFLLLLLALAACKLDFPTAKYAVAQRFENGNVVQTWQLDDDQLQRLSSWIDEHKSGWSKSYATYVPGTYIQMTNAAGKSSYINILTATTIVATYGESQFTQSFDAAEVQRLLSIVGTRSQTMTELLSRITQWQIKGYIDKVNAGPPNNFVERGRSTICACEPPSRLCRISNPSRHAITT